MNDENLNKFKYLIGNLVMNCQCIERDLKLIYGILETDNVSEAIHLFAEVQESKKTLGYIANKLIETGYFDEEESYLLKNITYTRNYWLHQAFLDFIYDMDDYSTFEKIYERLERDNQKIEDLQRDIENYRLSIY